MVADLESFESVSVVTTPDSTTPSPHTLGEAIAALNERVRKAGVSVEFTEPAGVKSRNSSVSKEIVHCPKLIDLAISQAIDFGKAKRENVGASATTLNVFVPGNVIALVKDRVILQANEDGTVKWGAYGSFYNELPVEDDNARFLVVSGGSGKLSSGKSGRLIALYQPKFNYFLRVKENCVFGSGTPAYNVEDRPRADEILEVYPKKDGNFTLSSRFSGSGQCISVKQVKGLNF